MCEAEVKHSAAEHAGAPSSRGRCLLTRQNITSVVASEKLEQQEKKKKEKVKERKLKTTTVTLVISKKVRVKLDKEQHAQPPPLLLPTAHLFHCGFPS